MKRLHSPESGVECTKDGNRSRSQFVGRNLSRVQTRHGRDGESIECLEEEDYGNCAVDTGLVRGRAVNCIDLSGPAKRAFLEALALTFDEASDQAKRHHHTPDAAQKLRPSAHYVEHETSDDGDCEAPAVDDDLNLSLGLRICDSRLCEDSYEVVTGGRGSVI